MKTLERVWDDSEEMRERVRNFAKTYSPSYDPKRWTDEVFEAIRTGTPPLALWRVVAKTQTVGHLLAQPLHTHAGKPFLFVHQAAHDGPRD